MRPYCKCHDEPMHKAGWQHGYQSWRCAVKARRRQARDYASKPWYREMKKNQDQMAKARKAERERNTIMEALRHGTYDTQG